MTIAIILAAIIGFLAAVIRSGIKATKAAKDIEEDESFIVQHKTELDAAQKEADDAVKDYINSLSKLDDDTDGSGGTVH